jgi:hypothetical protein
LVVGFPLFGRLTKTNDNEFFFGRHDSNPIFFDLAISFAFQKNKIARVLKTLNLQALVVGFHFCNDLWEGKLRKRNKKSDKQN